MAHHRLFVGLPLPAEARAHLLATMGGIAGARWQDDAQLHCTVRFLGELDGHVAEEVAAQLSGLNAAPIDVAFDGLGTFDRGGRIDTLWVGLAPVCALRALHAKIDRRIVAVGLPPDPRAYRPHVTIARFGRSVGVPFDLAVRLAPPGQLAFRFDEVRLYESLLGRDGARYETVARYRLG